MIIIVVEIIFP